MSLLTALTSAIKIAGLLPGAAKAVSAIASLFTRPEKPDNSTEANRHGAASGTARNAASDATERMMRDNHCPVGFPPVHQWTSDMLLRHDANGNALPTASWCSKCNATRS